MLIASPLASPLNWPLNWIVSRFRAQPSAPPLSDPVVIDRMYGHFRLRIMYSLFIGYALFYLCRKNLAIAKPSLVTDLHFTNTQFGLLDTLLYVTYGIGKLVNGILGDHVNPRLFMALGLLLSALMNLCFGFSTALWALCLFWAMNGWFQSMGFPPCARLLAHWYSVSERGLRWGIWNASHQIGGALTTVLCGYYLARWLGWRSEFVVPALLCALGALLLWERVRDIPATMGLPAVARYRQDPEMGADGRELSDEPESIRQVLFSRVLNNPYIWLISLMNLFVYVVRSGTFDWAAKFLVERKGTPIEHAALITGSFEVAGIFGAVLSGVVSDRLTGGRRGPACLLWMLLTISGVALFYAVPAGHPLWDAASLSLIGFAIYGPQFLVGVFVTDLASPKAAATAIGLTGVFGYAGSALSGVGTGYFVDRFGWSGAFTYWGGAALVGALCAAPLWNVGRRRKSRDAGR